ncbi:MAG: ammonia-forming cytochrome c nitrite reductase subunit c552 [Armatimonadota bacterium]
MKTITGFTARLAVLLAATALTGALLLEGCGGGSTSLATNPFGFRQVGATYMGTQRCRNCHATIADQYEEQDMGDAETHMEGDSCNNCHSTGYGKGGYDLANPDTHFLKDEIGCEECHGPGSKHVAAETIAERKAQITRTPPAEQVCWGCHGDRGKNAAGKYDPSAITKPAVTVDDAKLYTERPYRVGTHYAPAAMLLGRSGYGVAAVSSPHATLQNTCLDCHKPGLSSPAEGGQVNHGVDALKPNLDRTRAECASCHSSRNETMLQAGVIAKLIELGGEDPANPGFPDKSAGGGLLNDYADDHGIVTNTNDAPDDPYVKIYKAARHNWACVVKDGSFGVHNPEFATRLIEKAFELLGE